MNFNTVESILADTCFQKFLKWLHKQHDPRFSKASAGARAGRGNIGNLELIRSFEWSPDSCRICDSRP